MFVLIHVNPNVTLYYVIGTSILGHMEAAIRNIVRPFIVLTVNIF